MAEFSFMDKAGIPSIRINGERPSSNHHHTFLAPAPIGAPQMINLGPPTSNARQYQRFVTSSTVVQRASSAVPSSVYHQNPHRHQNQDDDMLDDSLTNLNWLQGVKLGVMPGSTPPTSPRNGMMLKGPQNNNPSALAQQGFSGQTYVTTPRGSQVIKTQQQQVFISPNGEHHHLVPSGIEQIQHSAFANGEVWHQAHMEAPNGYYTSQPSHMTLPPICTVMEPTMANCSSLDQLISGSGNGANAKPSYSYSQLIYFALTSSPDRQQMTLQEIYEWIMEQYPYFRTADPSWQSSVRKNLQLNRCFERVSRKRDAASNMGAATKPTTLWQLSRNYAFLLDNSADIDDSELSPRRRFADTSEEPSKRLKVSGDLTDLFGPELVNDLLSAETALFTDLAHDSDHPGLIGVPPPFGMPPLKLEPSSGQSQTRTSSGGTHTSGLGHSSTGEVDADSIEELLLQDMVNEMNREAPVDLLTGEALDLTVTGISLRPPPDWWAPEVAELLMNPPSSHGDEGCPNHNETSGAIDPLVTSLTASFFAADGSLWANADWDPESLDNFQPAGPKPQ